MPPGHLVKKGERQRLESEVDRLMSAVRQSGAPSIMHQSDAPDALMAAMRALAEFEMKEAAERGGHPMCYMYEYGECKGTPSDRLVWHKVDEGDTYCELCWAQFYESRPDLEGEWALTRNADEFFPYVPTEAEEVDDSESDMEEQEMNATWREYTTTARATPREVPPQAPPQLRFTNVSAQADPEEKARAEDREKLAAARESLAEATARFVAQAADRRLAKEAKEAGQGSPPRAKARPGHTHRLSRRHS